MNEKCISIVVLSACLHSLVAGCVKATTVQQPQINAQSAECCVYEVILTTGEKYQFEKPGGRYKTVPHLIIGTLNDGRKFFLNLTDENIKEIRISAGQTVSRADLARNPDQKISEIMVGGIIYTFDKNGGGLLTDVETIHGKTTTGVQIDIPVEDVLNATVKSVDPEKTGTAAGIGVFGTILLALLAAAVFVAITGPSM
jgi:hypothetical protein